MDLKSRIGIDLGRKTRVEEAVAWGQRHGVRYVQCEIDMPPNALRSFTAERAAPIRAACETSGTRLGLHTLSAVNVAEFSPFVSEAVDRYLEAYVDAAERLGASWIVVHAGYHFGGDYKARQEAGLERLKRAADFAGRKGVRLLLENLNKEPDDAEVHYLAHNVEETLYYLDRIQSPHLGWAFTINHAHLVPEGIDGHIDALDLKRCGEVRLADNLGDREVHLKPGDGNIDFARTFRRIEDAGFTGHYMCNFGSPDDMLAGREVLAEIARRA